MKPISERRSPEDLTEDEIIEEYGDVIVALETINAIPVYKNDCVSNDYKVRVNAKAYRLKYENVNIFFEHLYNDSHCYDEFIDAVNECVLRLFPGLEYDFLPKLTGFEGRSGGHFCIYVHAPESVVEVQRYIDHFVAYDLADVNYEVVQEFVDNINAMYNWINEYIIEYWNNECDYIREQQEAERAFEQRFRCPACDSVLEKVIKITSDVTISRDAVLGYDKHGKPALIDCSIDVIIDSPDRIYCCPKCGYATNDPDDFIRDE